MRSETFTSPINAVSKNDAIDLYMNGIGIWDLGGEKCSLNDLACEPLFTAKLSSSRLKELHETFKARKENETEFMLSDGYAYAVYTMADIPENTAVFRREYSGIVSMGADVPSSSMYNFRYWSSMTEDKKEMSLLTLLRKIRSTPIPDLLPHESSIGDIIVLKDGLRTTCFYVNANGFVPLKRFYEDEDEKE